MGRAMLILCAGALISIGFIGTSASRQGLQMTERNVDYADFIMAKNSAKTAIQMAMQHINEDEDWPVVHSKSNPWTPVIAGREISLFTEYQKDPDYWMPDELRLVSRAEYGDITVEVNSLYLMQPFSSLVPDFEGALQIPGDLGNFNIDGNAHRINGTPPAASGCEPGDIKPPVVVRQDETKDLIDAERPNLDGEVAVNPNLNYEPTDELIERLWNSGNTIQVTPEYKDQLGSAENPGVFFIDGKVKLTGRQSQGFGIMVIRSGGIMEYEGELSVAGNFKFHGLIIFENAFDFDGRGTPTINGSILVGNTEEYNGPPIDIDLGGNIEINYDCKGEEYAKKAAATAVKQNKYTRVVSSERVRHIL